MSRTVSLSLAFALSACSILPGNAESPEAKSPETTHAVVDDAPKKPAYCGRSWENAPAPEFASISWSGDRGIEKRIQMELLSKPDQWVALKADDGTHRTELLARTLKKGEPLLLLECSETSAMVATTDFDRVSGIPFALIDGTPSQFTFAVDAAPSLTRLKGVPEGDFDADKIFELSTTADRAAVSGAQQALDGGARCKDEGIGACQTAEAKVTPGPDFETRRSNACSAARAQGLAKCMGPLGKQYDPIARKLDAQERKRLADSFKQVRAKLGG